MRRTTRRADRRIATSAFIPAAGVALVVVVWVAAARLVNAPIVLPGPTATIVALWDAVRDPAFLGHLTGTLLRAVGGFVAAYLAGLAWGVIGATRPRIGRLLHPALVFIRATPVIAVILLALIWFRSSVAPLFVTLLMVLPLVVANVVSGVHA
ncbi:MAG: ABC transporter permease, partial [Spirochaetota bacterium]